MASKINPGGHSVGTQDDGFDVAPAGAGSSIDWDTTQRFVASHWRIGVAAFLAFGAISYGGSFLVTPMFTSRTTLLSPQQQNSAASALASLGSLSGLSGLSAVGGRSSIDQYVSLLGSETIADRLIDRFKLMDVYKVDLREKARKRLENNSKIQAGKKDGLISIEVEDSDPKRAAAIANQYVDELRRLMATLAVSEAQQRRVFFQNQLEDAKGKLTKAQTVLQQSGFNPGAINAEPTAAANGYTRLRAELAAAQVKLDTLRASMADGSPAVQQQLVVVAALQAQLDKLEGSLAGGTNTADYITKYREFKYNETLFDIMAKQYEIARVDESREGALIQVVDSAHPAERRTSPRRAYFALGGGLAGVLIAGIVLMIRQRRERRDTAGI